MIKKGWLSRCIFQSLESATKFIGQIICQNKKNVFGRVLSRLIDALFRASQNHNYDLVTNGEVWLIKKIKGLKIRTIFDVGANQGSWATIAFREFSSASIYAFEPIPKTFQILKKNFGGKKNLNCFNFGLSDKTEDLSFHIASASHELSSAVKIIVSDSSHTETCKVIDAYSFCQENQIDEIDFLKVDVEGMEHRVFYGFREMFKKKKIKIIQFEYGLVNIETGFLLKHFYDFFESYGYEVGKLYPTFVDFKNYDYRDENFVGPNYIAILPEFKSIL